MIVARWELKVEVVAGHGLGLGFSGYANVVGSTSIVDRRPRVLSSWTGRGS